MSLNASIRDELKKSPVTIALAFLALSVGAGSFFIAWIQFSAPLMSVAAVNHPAAANLNFSNLLMGLAFSLGSSLAGALVIRLLARVHWFAAFVFSMPAAVLSAFGTMLVVYMLPPKTLTVDALAVLQETVVWSTCAIFVAFNGLPVMRDIAQSDDDSREPDAQKGAGTLVIAILILMVWGGTVAAGLSKLVRALLL